MFKFLKKYFGCSTEVSYSDEGLEEWQGGLAKTYAPSIIGFCKVTIREKYKNDAGLLNHELKHVQQFRSNFFHNILYKYSKKYRYKCEIQAYKEQIKTYNYKSIEEIAWIVEAIKNKYSLEGIYSEAKIKLDLIECIS